MVGTTVSDVFRHYRPQGADEIADVQRVRALLGEVEDPWSRRLPLHITASALIVHPASGRVLLRWHENQRAWLQIGGHAEPTEGDPLAIAVREGEEETGLHDLTPWPDSAVRHLVIVPVAGGEYEHADIRFVLATNTPLAARPEKPEAPVRWLSVDEAVRMTTEANLHETLTRAAQLLSA